MTSDLCGLTATQAARLIRDGRLQPNALTDAYLDNIAAPTQPSRPSSISTPPGQARPPPPQRLAVCRASPSG